MIRFVDEHRDRFGVEFLCRTLRAAVRGFLTSLGYRAAKSRPTSVRRLRDKLLVSDEFVEFAEEAMTASEPDIFLRLRLSL